MSLAKQRLDQRLADLYHEAKKSLGQNFLVSDQVIDRIIQAVVQEKPERLVEIGPGPGALTDLLRQKFGNYIVIELDSKLASFWKTQDMQVIEADALQFDWSALDVDVLVSNLPYQISSSIVIERSLDRKPLRSMILMFQKEVAQRIRAQKQTEFYGMLSVIAQEFWTIETVTDAGSADFFPAPKVSSRVLKFRKKESTIVRRTQYLDFVKTCFKQRRRILKSNLSSQQTAAFLQWVQNNKLSDKVRAEELSIDQMRSLYFHLGGS